MVRIQERIMSNLELMKKLDVASDEYKNLERIN